MNNREELLASIEEITARLKRPGLSAVERLMMHEDRKDLREALRKLTPEAEAANG